MHQGDPVPRELRALGVRRVRLGLSPPITAGYSRLRIRLSKRPTDEGHLSLLPYRMGEIIGAFSPT